MKDKIFAILCFALFSTFPVFSDSYRDYLKLLKDYAHLRQIGNYKVGEIEIVSDRKRIKEIEDLQYMRLIKKGKSKEEAVEASRVGIIAKDQYWVWVRDAVIFPTGAEGTYNRIIYTSGLNAEAIAGVAVLPLLEDKRIVLNLNYRHATGRWELEVPRGFKNPGEEIEKALERELKEETGLQLVSHIYLGSVAPDTGSLGVVIPVYAATIGKKGVSNQDYSEAILRTEALSVGELKKAYSDGKIELDIKGKKEEVFVRDSFLAYALLQAEMKGLL